MIYLKAGMQAEPGKPGAEVSKKNYKSKKEFAYRMCTGRPTTAMPKGRDSCARYPWAVPSGGGWFCFRCALNVVM